MVLLIIFESLCGFYEVLGSLFTEWKEVVNPIISDLRILFKETLQAIESVLLIGSWIKPYFYLIKALSDLDPDAAHNIDKFILRTDCWENCTLP